MRAPLAHPRPLRVPLSRPVGGDRSLGLLLSPSGRLVPGPSLPGRLLPVLPALARLLPPVLLSPLGLLLHALLRRRLVPLALMLRGLTLVLLLPLGLRLESLALGLLLESLLRALLALRLLPVALLGLLEAHR